MDTNIKKRTNFLSFVAFSLLAVMSLPAMAFSQFAIYAEGSGFDASAAYNAAANSASLQCSIQGGFITTVSLMNSYQDAVGYWHASVQAWCNVP